MNKKMYFLLVISFFYSFAKSQQLVLVFNNGIAKGESNSFKKNMYNVDFLAGYQQKISKSLFLKTTVGLSTQMFDQNSVTSNIHTQRNNFHISAMLNFLIPTKSQTGNFVCGFGINESFALKDVSTSFINNEKKVTRVNVKGTNVSFAAELGYLLQISNKSQIAFLLNNQVDLFQKYKVENQKIKYNKTLFNISYYLMLKKNA